MIISIKVTLKEHDNKEARKSRNEKREKGKEGRRVGRKEGVREKKEIKERTGISNFSNKTRKKARY